MKPETFTIQVTGLYKNNFNHVVRIVEKKDGTFYDESGICYNGFGVCFKKGRNWDLYTTATVDDLNKQNAEIYRRSLPAEKSYRRMEEALEDIGVWSTEQTQAMPTKDQLRRNLEKINLGLYALQKMGMSIQSTIGNHSIFFPEQSQSLVNELFDFNDSILKMRKFLDLARFELDMAKPICWDNVSMPNSAEELQAILQGNEGQSTHDDEMDRVKSSMNVVSEILSVTKS
jgi:hypothetical protein